MKTEEVQALNRVLDHYGHDEYRHWMESGQPDGHIFHSLALLARDLPPINKFWTGEYRRFQEVLDQTVLDAG